MQSVNSCFKYIIILDLPPIISADLHMNYRAVNSHHFNPQARSIKRKWNEYKCFISLLFFPAFVEKIALVFWHWSCTPYAMQCNTPDLRMHTKHMLSNRVLFAFAFRLARLAIFFHWDFAYIDFELRQSHVKKCESKNWFYAENICNENRILCVKMKIHIFFFSFIQSK